MELLKFKDNLINSIILSDFSRSLMKFLEEDLNSSNQDRKKFCFSNNEDPTIVCLEKKFNIFEKLPSMTKEKNQEKKLKINESMLKLADKSTSNTGITLRNKSSQTYYSQTEISHLKKNKKYDLKFEKRSNKELEKINHKTFSSIQYFLEENCPQAPEYNEKMYGNKYLDKFSVVSLATIEHYNELFAVAYSNYIGERSFICLWSLKNDRIPRKKITLDNSVQRIEFHKNQPFTLMVLFVDGSVVSLSLDTGHFCLKINLPSDLEKRQRSLPNLFPFSGNEINQLSTRYQVKISAVQTFGLDKILVGTEDGFVIEGSPFEIFHRFAAHIGPIFLLKNCPTNSFLFLSSGLDSKVKVWKRPTNKCIYCLEMRETFFHVYWNMKNDQSIFIIKKKSLLESFIRNKKPDKEMEIESEIKAHGVIGASNFSLLLGFANGKVQKLHILNE